MCEKSNVITLCRTAFFFPAQLCLQTCDRFPSPWVPDPQVNTSEIRCVPTITCSDDLRAAAVFPRDLRGWIHLPHPLQCEVPPSQCLAAFWPTHPFQTTLCKHLLSYPTSTPTCGGLASTSSWLLLPSVDLSNPWDLGIWGTLLACLLALHIRFQSTSAPHCPFYSSGLSLSLLAFHLLLVLPLLIFLVQKFLGGSGNLSCFHGWSRVFHWAMFQSSKHWHPITETPWAHRKEWESPLVGIQILYNLGPTSCVHFLLFGSLVSVLR